MAIARAEIWRHVAALASPFAWRSRARAAARYLAFAAAERQSELELRRAAALCHDPRRRALYLLHALEEARHARVFASRARELATSSSPDGADHEAAGGTIPVDLEHLFERHGEPFFVAFVHRGEARGRAQFEAYREHFEARGDARSARVFEGVLADERRHEAYTCELLVELTGSERRARALLLRAAAWEAWRALRRSGRRVASSLYAITMLAVYAVAAPIFTLRARLRRPPLPRAERRP